MLSKEKKRKKCYTVNTLFIVLCYGFFYIFTSLELFSKSHK